MDAQSLEARLQEAVIVLANYRTSQGPREPRASWPEPIADFWSQYGRHVPRMRRPVPNADQIARMDEALDWISALRRQPVPDEPERILLCRILWARAARFSWQAIADQLRAHGHKTSGSTVKRRYEVGLALLLGIVSDVARKNAA